MLSPTLQSTGVQPQTPILQQQKLKFACDACARRKISCPKQQPECERCVSRGQRCIYSPACRYGKRKAIRTTTLPSSSESQTDPTPTSSTFSENGDSCTPSDGTLTNSPATSDLSAELTAGNVFVPFSNFSNNLSFTSNSLNEVLRQPVGHPVTGGKANETLFSTCNPYQATSMYPYPEVNYFPPYVDHAGWPLQQISPIATSALNYRDESSLESTLWSGSVCSSCSVTRDIGAASLVDQALPQLHQRPHESCFTRTCNILKTLKRPSSKACIFDFTHVPCSGNPQQPVSNSVEKILRDTDYAIEHVASVLQCACHNTSSVRCALTLALFEVMSWYEIIVLALRRMDGKKAAQDSSPSSSSDEVYDSSCSTSPRTPAESNGLDLANTMSVPTVCIGEMRLSHTEANSVLSSLIRSRISKVREMVQAMSSN